jgi:hypothetical protein
VKTIQRFFRIAFTDFTKLLFKNQGLCYKNLVSLQICTKLITSYKDCTIFTVNKNFKAKPDHEDEVFPEKIY